MQTQMFWIKQKSESVVTSSTAILQLYSDHVITKEKKRKYALDNMLSILKTHQVKILY